MFIKISNPWVPSVRNDPFFIENGTQHPCLIEVHKRSEDEDMPKLLVDDKSTTDSAKLSAPPGSIEGLHAASKHQVFEASSPTAPEYGKLYQRGTLAPKKDASKAKRFAFPIATGVLLRIKITKCHGECPFIIRCVDSTWRYIKLEDDDFFEFPTWRAASQTQETHRQTESRSIPEWGQKNAFSPIGASDWCTVPSLIKPKLSRSGATTPVSVFRPDSTTELSNSSFSETPRIHPRALSLSCPPRTPPGPLFSGALSPRSTPAERPIFVERRTPGAPRFSPVSQHSTAERRAQDLMSASHSRVSSADSHSPFTPSSYTHRYNAARLSPPPSPLLQGKFKNSCSVFGSPVNDRKK